MKQLASMAYEQWDKLEEVVANEMALAAYDGLTSYPEEKPSSSCTPASNESMISSGSQNAEYVDKMGSRTATSSAPMATNSHNSLDSTLDIPSSDAIYWIPSIAIDDDEFTWSNSTNLVCWDQVD